MRVLVVDSDVVFGAELSRLLRPFGDVETSHDGADALAAIRARSFDLLISEWLLPSIDGIALVRALRESGSSATFVMCTVLGQREAREHALAAGVNEVLTKPVSAAAAVQAALGRATPASGTTVVKPANGNDDLAKFTGKAAWRDVSKTLVRGLAAATGRTLQESAGGASPSVDKYDSRTTLAMIDARSRLRFELGIFTTIEGGRELVREALRTRDPQPEEVNEFLSEMCNQTLGAVKSAMRVGGMHFTLLVPRSRFVQLAAGWGAQFPVARTVHVVGDPGLTMMLVVGLKSCAPRSLDVAALRENMVLADAIHDEDGSVLADAATRLTATLLVRLKLRAAGQRTTIVE
jgi:CheY-like chemotaxis protein